jgi:hypothetical protein
MGQLQSSSTRSDAAEGLLLGKTLGPRRDNEHGRAARDGAPGACEERYLSGILQRIVDREALGLGRGQQRRIGGHKQG